MIINPFWLGWTVRPYKFTAHKSCWTVGEGIQCPQKWHIEDAKGESQMDWISSGKIWGRLWSTVHFNLTSDSLYFMTILSAYTGYGDGQEQPLPRDGFSNQTENQAVQKAARLLGPLPPQSRPFAASGHWRTIDIVFFFSETLRW